MGRCMEGMMSYEPDRHDTVIASIGNVNVYACGVLGYITIDDGVYNHPDMAICATMTRDEAIAAARAILKHFGECE